MDHLTPTQLKLASNSTGVYSEIKEWIKYSDKKMNAHFIFSVILVMLVTCQIVKSVPVTAASEEHETADQNTPLDNQKYFEGDLAISDELIQAYYGNHSSGNEVITIMGLIKLWKLHSYLILILKYSCRKCFKCSFSLLQL